jgi:hypothetical protein
VGPLSTVVNLDRSGNPEVVTGSTAYRADGQVYWNNGLSDGFVAVGNFDTDDFPEIVVVAEGTIRVQNHDGTVLWGPNLLPGAGRGGPPTVADFDGDDQPEIGVADQDTYDMFETDGSLRWSQPTQDHSSSATGSSVFDFEADGYDEVVYNDETTLRIYDGETGSVLWSTPNSSFTGYEYPVIADVDNDANAEIVVSANDFSIPGFHGLRVFGDSADNWVRTRRIWNQHTYHIANVSERGAIPASEPEGWQLYNSFRQNELAPDEGLATAAPDLVAEDGGFHSESCAEPVILMVYVTNAGAIDVAPGVPVAFYLGDPRAGGTFIGIQVTRRVLKPGESERVFLEWSGAQTTGQDVYVRVDDQGNGVGLVNECGDDSNNLARIPNVHCQLPA